MKAIRVREFGAPSVLKLENDVPIPIPSKKEVIIKVHAVGINPVDALIRAGWFSFRPNLPYTPGLDVSGVVSKIGEDVTEFKVGDRVFTSNPDKSGAYAEFTKASVKYTFNLPENISFNQGAAIGVPYFTAYRSLFKQGKVCKDQTVLVHGASGAVGIAACQIGKMFGLKVVGTAGSAEGEKLVKENGADLVFNHRNSDYIQAIKESVPEGIDIILEMAANINLSNDISLLKKTGKVVIIGSKGPTTTINPFSIMMLENEIIGCALFNHTDEDFKESGEYIAQGLKDGHLAPVIGNKYELSEADKAHVDVMEQKNGAKGKIILEVVKNNAN